MRVQMSVAPPKKTPPCEKCHSANTYRDEREVPVTLRLTIEIRITEVTQVEAV